ncbi:unnamed protein product [Owenia fusiformis]|uniref:C3H1-type domain-containing protein n=1 Tax=Owenia fusiformis TaxID=6347 RepID=A0A8S4NRI8_OWEFU|nr:unnamed protein product [Owenia fusiformis]
MRQLFGIMALDPTMPSSSLQSWLGHELEIRGIDAVVYTRYILSILQQDHDQDFIETHSFPFEKKRDSKVKTHKSKKQEKRKSAELSSEEFRKSAAVECLLSVTDEDTGIETLVDELYIKLKEHQINQSLSVVSPCQADLSEGSDSVLSTSPDDPAERYYAAFPALSDGENGGTPQPPLPPPIPPLQQTAPTVWRRTSKQLFTKSGADRDLSPYDNVIVGDKSAPTTPKSDISRDVSPKSGSSTPSKPTKGDRKDVRRGGKMSTREKSPYTSSSKSVSSSREVSPRVVRRRKKSHQNSDESYDSRKYSRRHHSDRVRNRDSGGAGGTTRQPPKAGKSERVYLERSHSSGRHPPSRTKSWPQCEPSFILPSTKVLPHWAESRGSRRQPVPSDNSRTRRKVRTSPESRAESPEVAYEAHHRLRTVKFRSVPISSKFYDDDHNPLLLLNRTWSAGESNPSEDVTWYTEPFDVFECSSPIPGERLYHRQSSTGGDSEKDPSEHITEDILAIIDDEESGEFDDSLELGACALMLNNDTGFLDVDSKAHGTNSSRLMKLFSNSTRCSSPGSESSHSLQELWGLGYSEPSSPVSGQTKFYVPLLNHSNFYLGISPTSEDPISPMTSFHSEQDMEPFMLTAPSSIEKSCSVSSDSTIKSSRLLRLFSNESDTTEGTPRQLALIEIEREAEDDALFNDGDYPTPTKASGPTRVIAKEQPAIPHLVQFNIEPDNSSSDKDVDDEEDEVTPKQESNVSTLWKLNNNTIDASLKSPEVLHTLQPGEDAEATPRAVPIKFSQCANNVQEKEQTTFDNHFIFPGQTKKDHLMEKAIADIEQLFEDDDDPFLPTGVADIPFQSVSMSCPSSLSMAQTFPNKAHVANTESLGVQLETPGIQHETPGTQFKMKKEKSSDSISAVWIKPDNVQNKETVMSHSCVLLKDQASDTITIQPPDHPVIDPEAESDSDIDFSVKSQSSTPSDELALDTSVVPNISTELLNPSSATKLADVPFTVASMEASTESVIEELLNEINEDLQKALNITSDQEDVGSDQLVKIHSDCSSVGSVVEELLNEKGDTGRSSVPCVKSRTSSSNAPSMKTSQQELADKTASEMSSDKSFESLAALWDEADVDRFEEYDNVINDRPGKAILMDKCFSQLAEIWGQDSESISTVSTSDSLMAMAAEQRVEQNKDNKHSKEIMDDQKNTINPINLQQMLFEIWKTNEYDSPLYQRFNGFTTHDGHTISSALFLCDPIWGMDHKSTTWPPIWSTSTIHASPFNANRGNTFYSPYRFIAGFGNEIWAYETSKNPYATDTQHVTMVGNIGASPWKNIVIGPSPFKSLNSMNVSPLRNLEISASPLKNLGKGLYRLWDVNAQRRLDFDNMTGITPAFFPNSPQVLPRDFIQGGVYGNFLTLSYENIWDVNSFTETVGTQFLDPHDLSWPSVQLHFPKPRALRRRSISLESVDTHNPSTPRAVCSKDVDPSTKSCKDQFLHSENSAFHNQIPGKLSHVHSEPVIVYQHQGELCLLGGHQNYAFTSTAPPVPSQIAPAQSQPPVRPCTPEQNLQVTKTDSLLFSPETHFRPIKTPPADSPQTREESLELDDECEDGYQLYQGSETNTIKRAFIPKFRVKDEPLSKSIQTSNSPKKAESGYNLDVEAKRRAELIVENANKALYKNMNSRKSSQSLDEEQCYETSEEIVLSVIQPLSDSPQNVENLYNNALKLRNWSDSTTDEPGPTCDSNQQTVLQTVDTQSPLGESIHIDDINGKNLLENVQLHDIWENKCLDCSDQSNVKAGSNVNIWRRMNESGSVSKWDSIDNLSSSLGETCTENPASQIREHSQPNSYQSCKLMWSMGENEFMITGAGSLEAVDTGTSPIPQPASPLTHISNRNYESPSVMVSEAPKRKWSHGEDEIATDALLLQQSLFTSDEPLNLWSTTDLNDNTDVTLWGNKPSTSPHDRTWNKPAQASLHEATKLKNTWMKTQAQNIPKSSSMVKKHWSNSHSDSNSQTDIPTLDSYTSIHEPVKIVQSAWELGQSIEQTNQDTKYPAHIHSVDVWPNTATSLQQRSAQIQLDDDVFVDCNVDFNAMMFPTDGPGPPHNQDTYSTEVQTQPYNQALYSRDAQTQPHNQALYSTDAQTQPHNQALYSTDAQTQAHNQALYSTDAQTQDHNQALYSMDDPAHNQALYSTDSQTQAHNQALYSTDSQTQDHNQALYSTDSQTQDHNQALYSTDCPGGLHNQALYSTELEEQWLAADEEFQVQTPKRKGERPGNPRKPCSFFLEGQCRRTDCKFTHDLSTITCRFWEEGECFKGITCPFLHGYHGGNNCYDKSEEFLFEHDDFPELGSKGEKPAASRAGKGRQHNSSKKHGHSMTVRPAYKKLGRGKFKAKSIPMDIKHKKKPG